MITYIATILVFLIYNILTAMAANLTIGYLGLFNLGLVALVGIGAYSYAISMNAGLGFFLSFIIASILPGLFSIGLYYITRRLKGDYFGIATLGFSYIVYAILLNFEFSNGAFGIAGIPRPNLFGLSFNTPELFLIFSTIIFTIIIIISYKLTHSRFGNLMQAIRDDETSIKVLGKNTDSVKYKVLFFSGIICGISGFIYASFVTFIDPSSFLLSPLIVVLTITILGGLASFSGTIYASIIITLIPEILRFIGLPSSILGPVRILIYSSVLVMILMYKSNGLFSKIKYD